MNERPVQVMNMVKLAGKAECTVEVDWQPAGGYAGRAPDLKTRLFGLGGTGTIVSLLIGGALFTWTSYQAVDAPRAISVFNVAPLAAPPEPQHEIPPGPEQIQKEKPEPKVEIPKIDPPEVMLPTSNPIPIMIAKPTPEPGPVVAVTTAPESRPLPPSEQMSSVKPTWEGMVLGALNKVKRYPKDAHYHKQQGVPYIRFVMNRLGKVLSVTLERSSGFRSLDNEAMALPRRAQPLPRPPEEVKGDTIELVLPVEFFMR